MYDTITQKYNLITKHIIRENAKKEGIEIYFSSIPSGLERDTLKENNWKWSSFNKCWYIKKAEIAIETQKLVEKKEKIEKTKQVAKTKKIETPKKVINEKQVLSVVKKILDYGEKHARPVLSRYKQLEENKVVFTDSYRLCILNRDSLPFEKEEHNYPNVKNIINEYLEKTSDETFTFNVEEVKNNANENKGYKNKDKRMMTFTTDRDNKITLDSEYLYDMVKLLQIKDSEVKMNYYGEIKPTTYENENGFYLVVPIKTF